MQYRVLFNTPVLIGIYLASNLLAQIPSSHEYGSVKVNGASFSANLTYQFNGLSSAPSFYLKYGIDFAIASSNCAGTTVMTCTVAVVF
jgi:hypothetical protein